MILVQIRQRTLSSTLVQIRDKSTSLVKLHSAFSKKLHSKKDSPRNEFTQKKIALEIISLREKFQEPSTVGEIH